MGQVRALPVPVQPVAAPAAETPPFEGDPAPIVEGLVRPLRETEKPEFEPMLAELETAETALRSAAATLARAREAIQAAIEQSVTLEATAQTLSECERDLTTARTAGERERIRALALETELTRRNDVFHTLRSKLRDLLGSVESDGSSMPLL